eukprot:3054905-Prymnesium_polylepis.1
MGPEPPVRDPHRPTDRPGGPKRQEIGVGHVPQAALFCSGASKFRGNPHAHLRAEMNDFR